MGQFDRTYMDIIAQMNTRRNNKHDGIARDIIAECRRQAC